jgi:hypothetical protein
VLSASSRLAGFSRAIVTSRAFAPLALLLMVGPSVIASASAQGGPPAIATDKERYGSGEKVKIKGEGWAPGEAVTIVVEESPTSDSHAPVQAVADESGAFVSTDFEADEHESEITFVARATGASGSKAEARFENRPIRLADDWTDDPDLPSFVLGAVNKQDYLRSREEWINAKRGVEHGRRFDPRARGRAIRAMQREEATAVPPAGIAGGTSSLTPDQSAPAASTAVWVPIGPAPLSNGQTFGLTHPVSGRVSSIALHPTNSNIAYVGAAQGGVYRTLDGGVTWKALFDSAETLAVGAIAIAPSRPSTIYVGTGEGNFSADSFFGVGVYRIDNADGPSPVLVGPLNKDAANNDVLSGWGIDKIVVHPTNPDVIFVAVASGLGGISGTSLNDATAASAKPRGLFRSTNATEASPVFTRLSVATDNGGNLSSTDIEFEPGNPNTLLTTVRGTSAAGSGGVYRSTNALDAVPTFTRTLSVVSATALNRAEIAINKTGSQVTVFAATADSNGTLKRSLDGGVTWSAALTGATGFCGTQCNYDMPIAVDPTNANIVYLGGPGDGTAPTGIFNKSTTALAAAPTFAKAQTGLHADEHAIEIDPSNPSTVWTGSDGGIWKSTDAAANWVSLNNRGFSATQFQSIALHPADRFFTIGGTQDNGTEWLRPDGTWTRADFGDGGHAVIDSNAADTTNVTMYHTYFNQIGNLVAYSRVQTTADAHDNGWTLFSLPTNDTAVEFYAPIALGPGNPNTFYFASDRLRRSVNAGATTTVVSQAPIVSGVSISALAISPQNDNVRVVGLANGKVFRTTTGSSTLNDVTGTIPAKYIAKVKIDPTSADIAYVTLSGYFGNATPHIYKTTNLSAAAPTWTGIGSTIPDVPVNGFVIDPANTSNLYAGTDIGVYRSLDGGATWGPFSNGLPRVTVFDMAIQNPGRVLRIATHGRGMWEVSIATASGTLQGTVRDAVSLAPISGATVTVAASSTTTDAAGAYQFLNVAAGTYDVSASAAGYASGLVSGVVVTAGGTTTADIALAASTASGCVVDTTQADFVAATATDKVDLSTSPGDVKLPLSSIASVDQNNTPGSLFFVAPNMSGNNWNAQTFTAAATGRLAKVDVALALAAGGTGGSVRIEIRDVTGSTPGPTVLASAPITGVTATGLFLYTANFAIPTNVTAGTTYALVMRAELGGPFRTVSGSGSTYGGGALFSSSTAGGAWTVTANDLYFTTYVAPNVFLTPGALTSSIKDANAAGSAIANWTSLSWTAATPPGTTVRFQVAASNDASSGPFLFVGPDGTASTFFTTSGASLSQFSGYRYLMYKAYLSTSTATVTPVLSDVSACFGNLTVTSLATGPASGVYGGTTTLAATLTAGGAAVAGKTVGFALNGSGVGSATTDGSGTASLPGVSLAGIATGTYPGAVTASFAGDAGYTTTSGSASLTVTARPLVVSATGVDRPYDGTTAATVTLSDDRVPGDLLTTSYASASFADKNAGAARPITVSGIVVTGPAAGNYTFNTTATTTANVSPRGLTVSATGVDKVYDGTTNATVLLSDDRLTGDALITSYASASFVDKDFGGPKPVAVTGIAVGGPDAGNYSFNTTATTAASITRRPASVTPAAASKTYGDPDPDLSGVLSGFVPADGISAAYSRTPGETVAGSPYSISATLSPGSALGNYTIAASTAPFTITRASLTVKADDKTKELNAANPALTGTLTGVRSGDAITASYSTTATTTSPVGTYPIVPALADPDGRLGNYTVQSIDGTLRITYSIAATCLGGPNHQVLPPLSADGSSVFQQKSTVPVKFRVCDAAGASVGTPGLVQSFLLTQVIAGTTTTDVSVDPTSTTPDAAFRWDASGRQWIFNLSTKPLASHTTYVFRIGLADGSAIDFRFGLK